MSNALNKAVDTIMRVIPRQVLQKVFLEPANPWHKAATSLSFEILNQVIRPRVLSDCDIIGGTEAYIRLLGLVFERTPDLQTVFHVPKSRTDGRTITSALSLNYMDYAVGLNFSGADNFNNCSVTPLTVAAGQLASSFSTGVSTSTSRLRIIAENTILVEDSYVIPMTGSLQCVLSNDADLNNLSIRSYNYFAKLCTYAVESHIYNQLIITIDEGEVSAGRGIGAFKTVVDRYEGSEEKYQEELKVFKRVLFMDDKLSYRNFVRGQISLGR